MEDELQSQLKVLCRAISPVSRDIARAIQGSEMLAAAFEKLRTAIDQILPNEWAGKSFVHPRGSTAIRADSFGYWLIRVGHAEGVDTAVSYFNSFLGMKPYTVRTIHLYSGLILSDAVELAPDVKLVPIDKLESTESLQIAKDIVLHFESATSQIVVIEVSQEIEINISDEMASLEHEDIVKRTIAAVQRALVATNDMGLQKLAAWHEVPRSVFNIGGAGVSWFSTSGHLQRVHTGIDNLEITKKVFTWLASNQREESDRLNLCIDRLNSSMSPTSTENRAIDLTIALKTLTTQESDPNELLTDRIATRTACLCRQTLEDRKSIKKAVKTFYGKFRSAAIHSGRIKQKDLEKNPSLFLNINSLVREAIQKLILEYEGRIDWEEFDLRLEN